MSKFVQAILSFFILTITIFWSIYGTGPHVGMIKEVPENAFSVSRAFNHVEEIAERPHYVGSNAHPQVRNYIVSKLQEMGLLVQTQEGNSLNKYGTATRPQNIISKIEGTDGKSTLLLMTHYDSAMHSSFGASDAASGVGTILESVRAFLNSGQKPKNNIILLFTDAEELGLNGAGIFVESHPWAKDVDLALNFEARGSGGKSFMLLETTAGNKKIIEEFKRAGVEFPVTNSLAYSVYKMLPNDTDLTVLREQGNIEGLNFAFIDDHFDYHTARDTPDQLDLNSLAHQGNYLMPLLDHFSQISLEDMTSKEEVIFFSLPFSQIISYPYSWIFPMLLIACILFGGVLLYGFFAGHLRIRPVLLGFLPLVIALLLSGMLAFGLWELALYLYPEYLEMEHGFTYNGYYYIGAVVFLSLAVTFYIFNAFKKRGNAGELFVGSLMLWILIAAGAAVYLPGAAYFIIPVFFALFQLILLFKPIPLKILVHTLLSIPAIFLLSEFVIRFPVALGLDILFVSAILAVLLWVLLWPVFFHYRKMQLLGFLCFLTFLVFFVTAHFKADFNNQRPRPNSLVYLRDMNRELSTWNSYDYTLDSWVSQYLDEPMADPIQEEAFSSKYGTKFTYSSLAPLISIPTPFIEVNKDVFSKSGEKSYSVKIAPNREVNRIELYLDKNFDFIDVIVNEKEAPYLQPGHSDLHVFRNRWRDRVLEYYPVSRDTLRLKFIVKEGQHPTIDLYESAYDLINHPELKVQPRRKEMIPRPFVLNDAVILKTSFKLE